MKRTGWSILLAVLCVLFFCIAGAEEAPESDASAGALADDMAEARYAVTVSAPEKALIGARVDVQVTAGADAAAVTYTLTRGSETVFQGKEDSHFDVSFRPREAGAYTLSAEVKYGDGTVERAAAQVQVDGTAEESQGPEVIYSQKDGWWKEKAYSKTNLEKAGCAIFTLSHALQRMGWTGGEIAPEVLAVTYKNCYTQNGTANARLIHLASLVYGYSTQNALIKDKVTLRDGLKNGDLYSFSIVLGHIALMTGVDEKAGKVRVVDSAPSATLERIKKGKLYYLSGEEYVEVTDLSEIPGARYYFETGYYGGLEYYLDLDYCARRGGRLIRPTWLFYQGEGEKIGAGLVSLSSGESEITVNGQEKTVPTRELSWGETGEPMLAVVTQKKAVKLLNESGKKITSIPSCTVLPVLRQEADQVYVFYQEQRGYVKLTDAEVVSPLSGEIKQGVISVKGNTSGRATVKMRFGPSEKERVMANWKTGTKVVLIRQEGEFWQVEGKGLRLWVHQDYLTVK